MKKALITGIAGQDAGHLAKFLHDKGYKVYGTVRGQLESSHPRYQKLKIENGQNFSSSTQLKIQQTGVNAATTPYASGGYSFDDFKLYNAGRDVAVTNAKIKKVHCAKE
jgi:UDP-N-acetylmuramate-alanine ligase